MSTRSSDTILSHIIFSALCLFALCMGLLVSCDIEETQEVESGSVYVTASTHGGDLIIGAAISIDGIAQNQSTPDTVNNIPVGQHDVSLFKLGYVESNLIVDVPADVVIPVDISMNVAHDGTIILQDAPEGTVLLLNSNPYTVTSAPNEYVDMGFGSFDASAYLPGFATDLPALWTILLSESEPMITISPTFTAVQSGSDAGALAANFNLPSLEDSSLFELANYRGKVVFISFYFNACPPCLAEFPDIQAVYENPQLANKIQFFGINGQDPWGVFVNYLNDHPELGLEFPLLHDRMQTVRATDYAVEVQPTNFLIDKTGVIRYRWGGITEELLLNSIQALLAEGE
jgi:peroxiredoxin